MKFFRLYFLNVSTTLSSSNYWETWVTKRESIYHEMLKCQYFQNQGRDTCPRICLTIYVWVVNLPSTWNTLWRFPIWSMWTLFKWRLHKWYFYYFLYMCMLYVHDFELDLVMLLFLYNLKTWFYNIYIYIYTR